MSAVVAKKIPSSDLKTHRPPQARPIARALPHYPNGPFQIRETGFFFERDVYWLARAFVVAAVRKGAATGVAPSSLRVRARCRPLILPQLAAMRAFGVHLYSSTGAPS
jgi:hypothetical protein